jgi:hypothetical protein
MPMIAKDLMPWMFVKRTATWTPFVKIRSEQLAPAGLVASARTSRRLGKRPPRG